VDRIAQNKPTEIKTKTHFRINDEENKYLLMVSLVYMMGENM